MLIVPLSLATFDLAFVARCAAGDGVAYKFHLSFGLRIWFQEFRAAETDHFDVPVLCFCVFADQDGVCAFGQVGGKLHTVFFRLKLDAAGRLIVNFDLQVIEYAAPKHFIIDVDATGRAFEFDLDIGPGRPEFWPLRVGEICPAGKLDEAMAGFVKVLRRIGGTKAGVKGEDKKAED